MQYMKMSAKTSTKIDKLTKIIKGLKEVQQAQNSMNLGQRCSSGDLQVKVQKLTDHIQLFLNKIEATEKQLQELEKEMKKYEGLKKNLCFISTLRQVQSLLPKRACKHREQCQYRFRSAWIMRCQVYNTRLEKTGHKNPFRCYREDEG